jgi:hypothetical protein
MSNKELTQRQKIIQVQREIKKIIKNDLEKLMMLDIDYTINNIQMEDNWYQENDDNFLNLIKDRYIKNI